MATTFNVISLGNYANIDPTEGNTTAENAAALVGLTFGGIGNALANNIQSFAPGTTGFAGGNATAYDMDNLASSETFSIDGGADQTFDGTSAYNATITYIDGSTATISAVIFQDTAGNTYLAPEFSANADQAALEAAPIRSLTLDSLISNAFSGMTADRQTFNAVTCFTTGARIATPSGARRVETLQVGDAVTTRDNGAQVIRWIGGGTRPAAGPFAPIRIRKGALGQGLPRADLLVSQQHRMLMASKIAERVTGQREVLLPAKKMLDLPGVELVTNLDTVTYYHILLDRHEVVFAEEAPTESLLTGPMAKDAMGPEALAEIEALFPGLITRAQTPARPIPPGKIIGKLMFRHLKNNKPVLCPA